VRNKLFSFTGGFALGSAVYTYISRKLVQDIALSAFFRSYITEFCSYGALVGILTLITSIFLIKKGKKTFTLTALNLFSIYVITGVLPGMMLWLLLLYFASVIFQNKLFSNVDNTSQRNLLLLFVIFNLHSFFPYVINVLNGFHALSFFAINPLICTSALIVPLVFAPKILKPYTILILILMLLPALISSLYSYIFGIRLTEEAFFIIINTNNHEAFEFLQTYLSFGVIGITLVLIIIPLLLLKYTSK